MKRPKVACNPRTMMSELYMMIQTEDATIKKPEKMNISMLAFRFSVTAFVNLWGSAHITKIRIPAKV